MHVKISTKSRERVRSCRRATLCALRLGIGAEESTITKDAVIFDNFGVLEDGYIEYFCTDFCTVTSDTNALKNVIHILENLANSGWLKKRSTTRKRTSSFSKSALCGLSPAASFGTSR